MSTPTLVRVGNLEPGNDFVTALTGRAGVVVQKPDRGVGIACVIGEDEVDLHPDVLVIPSGWCWQKRNRRAS